MTSAPARQVVTVNLPTRVTVGAATVVTPTRAAVRVSLN